MTGRSVAGREDLVKRWFRCELPGCEKTKPVEAVKPPTCLRHQREMSEVKKSAAQTR